MLDGSAHILRATQSVCVTDGAGRRVLSKSLPNNAGVFQGSTLGPLLFCVFSNELSLHAPDACIVQYADDIQVLVRGRKAALDSTVARLEVTLEALSDWLTANEWPEGQRGENPADGYWKLPEPAWSARYSS